MSLIIETDFFVKAEELTIAIDNIESDTVLKLPQANRTKMHWPGVTLLQMVGSVKHARKVYTMH